MEFDNSFKLEFEAKNVNEGFARGVVALFCMDLKPTMSEINDIKTAVSEAVTNSIVHGYPNDVGEIVIQSEIIENAIHINIFDNGVGIENVSKALEPFYTSKPEEERSGMGFTIMKSFMDEVKVESEKGKGTKIYMTKIIAPTNKE